ncbi:unnamed protein product, partial [Ectocarpus fasciculatus]
CSLFGKSIAQEESVQAEKNLEHQIVQVLGAEYLSRWVVEVTYKLKKRTKKGSTNEMKHGVNLAAPFVGMKKDESIEYPFAKQFCIRRSDRGTRVMVVQEMAEEPSYAALPEGKLTHVLEGEDPLEAMAAATRAGLVTRIKASIEASGHAYRLGDFVVRVGKCKKGAVFRGLALEVEYRPCNRVADGLSMIEAFIPSIDEDGTFTAVSDLQDLAMFGRGPQFSIKHNALQITDLFNKVFA